VIAKRAVNGAPGSAIGTSSPPASAFVGAAIGSIAISASPGGA
jgi:hypothetical protein